MTDGAPPGVSGPVGAGGGKRRATQAWSDLMHVQFVAVPDAIRRSRNARARMRQLRKRVRG